MNHKVEALQRGETIISREPGNSMTPILKSRQPVRLAPVKIETKTEELNQDYIDEFVDLYGYEPEPRSHKVISGVNIGDIVFCKVHGHFYTHLVKAYNPKRGFLIGNNHGHNNGWTWKIYGKVMEIFPMDFKEPKISCQKCELNTKCPGFDFCHKLKSKESK